MAVLGISDRRLQPSLFKDEHPRSGRSLASSLRLRGALTSQSMAFTAPTCFGGSSRDTVALSSNRERVSTKPLTLSSFPNLLAVAFASAIVFSHQGQLLHRRVNVMWTP